MADRRRVFTDARVSKIPIDGSDSVANKFLLGQFAVQKDHWKRRTSNPGFMSLMKLG